MYCASCGKYIDDYDALNPAHAICPYCGAPPKSISPDLPNMPAVADVFAPIEEEKLRDPTFQEYRRAGGYFLNPNRISYREYLARKGEPKRRMVLRFVATIVVWAIVIVLGLLALRYIFPLI